MEIMKKNITFKLTVNSILNLKCLHYSRFKFSGHSGLNILHVACQHFILHNLLFAVCILRYKVQKHEVKYFCIRYSVFYKYLIQYLVYAFPFPDIKYTSKFPLMYSPSSLNTGFPDFSTCIQNLSLVYTFGNLQHIGKSNTNYYLHYVFHIQYYPFQPHLMKVQRFSNATFNQGNKKMYC